MSFKAFGINFSISVPFAVMLSFLLFMDSTGFMSASLIAVVLHESGHLLAMKLTHCAPKSIKCSLGGLTLIGKSFSSFKESIAISFSGPLVNLITALILWVFGSIYNELWLLAFAVVQFIVGAINLLPVKGLDGGTVLRLLLQKISVNKAELICSLVSIFTACIIFVVGLAVAVKNVSNPSLLLLGIYIIMINISKFNN